MHKKDEREAVFWCGLLRPLIFKEIAGGQVAAWLREVSQREVTFPNGEMRKPSVSTLKRKLRRYTSTGFAALARKQRADQGKIRAAKPEVLQTAITAKREQPKRSAKMLNIILQARHGKSVARSTLYRHLKFANATRLKLGFVNEPVRKRWTCDHTHDVWVGDFEDGPCVLLQGLSVRTYLSAFIDAHSRYVVAARYYLRESLDVLCDTLVRALSVHAVPKALYLDNAKVYHSHSLNTLCCRQHIRLWHRPKGDPEPGGLIERFIQTTQNQFESEVRAGDFLTLEKLNQAFNAWLEVGYHQQVHSETGQTPRARYDSGLLAPRQADMEAVAESFLQRERRTVDKVFSDIRLQNKLYRVDPKLRGDRLEVRYDPFGSGEKIWLYSLVGVYVGEGILHKRETGVTPTPPPTPVSRINLLDILIDKQKRLHQQEQGIDFSAATAQARWSFGAFAARLAELLGRSGGLTAFNAEELTALQDIHQRHPALTSTRLKKAFHEAGQKSLPTILLALQKNEE